MTTETASKQQGMGSIIMDKGVAFRVWAPHADSVSVVGTFNDWNGDSHPLEREERGYWYGEVSSAAVGDEYKYEIRNGDNLFQRIDPYAREVTNSIGNGVIHDPSFDWDGDAFQMPPWNEVVIYELHIGTFNRSDPNRPGSFQDAIQRLDYLKTLGVNVLQIMPVAEFAGDLSWGYNPAHIFAIESAYGGPRAFKDFVKAAHAKGFAVVMDVVYNHFGPSDLDLWQFDGWSQNGKGGIYFYNDYRSATPWGDTRPDYGRGEVRQFIYDNARMWLKEYHTDGLRYDMTAYIRHTDVMTRDEIPEGWSLMQWINDSLSAEFPGCLLIAEDLQADGHMTAETHHGGAGFSSQWDAGFVHPVRDVVEQADDANRSMWMIHDALKHRYNIDAFERVIYSESHDEVSNGKSRVPEEIDPGNPESVFAQKRSVLAAVLTMTSPGIPMLFQGQEFLEDDWFTDTDPLDWERAKQFRGLTRLYADLIHLRRNHDGLTRGLVAQNVNVHHVNDVDKVIAFHRFDQGGPGDDVIVVLNFSNRSRDAYDIGFPREGQWVLRANTDWGGYSEALGDHPSESVIASPAGRDGYPASATLSFGAYSALVFSQNADEAS